MEIMDTENNKPNYEKLEIWQEAMDLTKEVYKITQKFPSEEKFGLVDQIRRAIVSVALNIAEGQGRGTKPEFRRFLQMALGSLNETSTLLTLSSELSIVSQETITPLRDRSLTLMKRIQKLITKLQ